MADIRIEYALVLMSCAKSQQVEATWRIRSVYGFPKAHPPWRLVSLCMLVSGGFLLNTFGYTNGNEFFKAVGVKPSDKRR